MFHSHFKYVLLNFADIQFNVELIMDIYQQRMSNNLTLESQNLRLLRPCFIIFL